MGRALIVCVAGTLLAGEAAAHCDTLDGPVVADAKFALQVGKLDPVLKWVARDREPELADVFAEVLQVRSASPEVRAVADRLFFETLVRIHREGEGANFTGLKPAGEVDRAIVAADRTLESGHVDDLASRIGNAVRDAVEASHAEVMRTKKRANRSTREGRRYVEAYVRYVHLVEKLHSDLKYASGDDAHSH